MDELKIEPLITGGRAAAPADNAWAHGPIRPAWWKTAEDRDRQADEAARARHQAPIDLRAGVDRSGDWG